MKLKKVSKEEKEVEKRKRRGKNARNKGSNFEREVAKRFQEKYGIELKRTPQSGGFAKQSHKADDFRGDITLVDNLLDFLLHIECKNQKALSIPKWLKQAEQDCPNGKIPLVIFHQHGTSNNYVTLSLESFFHLVEKNVIVKEKK